MPAINVTKTKFEHADPILNVSDMAASVKYYVEALGFRNADWGNAAFTCVHRDTAEIYLARVAKGEPAPGCGLV